MNKIILWILALSFIALACGPGPQTIPAGPATPTPAGPATPTPAPTPAPRATPLSTATPSPTPKGAQTVTFREQALSSARSLLEQDSTFRFDGIKESVKLAGEKVLEEGKSYEFIYTFESRYAGYGDRAGKVMAAVITPHKARIVVRGGAVAEAVMDEQWDMLSQRMIEKK